MDNSLATHQYPLKHKGGAGPSEVPARLSRLAQSSPFPYLMERGYIRVVNRGHK